MGNNPQMSHPGKTTGLRHVALFCVNLESCVRFYTELLAMEIEWQPDPDNYYLTSGNDNLALHRAPNNFAVGQHQFLDHIGFILNEIESVDKWYEYLAQPELQIEILTKPRTHRDGARSFYCKDPDGRSVQMIYHPPLVDK